MRTLIIGLDAFDPIIFEHLLEQGRLPILASLANAGGYAPFGTADPPQSEVSWTSIATGLDPGGHGLFDFVHRNPADYRPIVSLLQMKSSFGGMQFVPPYTAKTIFDRAVSKGYPATTLWWPATFPARLQSPVRTLPGLGTPDIHGRLGVGTYFTSNDNEPIPDAKIPLHHLKPKTDGRLVGEFEGPHSKRWGREEVAYTTFTVKPMSTTTAQLIMGNQHLELNLGEWSPIIELSFKMGLFFTVRALTRLLLIEIEPHVSLYALPLNVHPLKSPWHYGSPKRFIKNTWKANGLFLTLGWPQDTTALEQGIISDKQFLTLCDNIMDSREQILFWQLRKFKEGILASVFDSLDRVQHMFLRQRPDIVAVWYEKLDRLVGRIDRKLREQGKRQATRLLVVSDHGFAPFDYKVHLSRWLMEQALLFSTTNKRDGKFTQIDWSRTRAYALGLNSIYLNLAGREGQGIIDPVSRERHLEEIVEKLKAWTGPDGRPVIRSVRTQQEAFSGPYAERGPDLVIGYNRGYRASQQTGLGGWGAEAIERNQDHWRADHCIDSTEVPGVIFADPWLLRNFSQPTFRDFPALAIDENLNDYGSKPTSRPIPENDLQSIEERLSGLGYLS